jgi:agmatinase/guanidinopropionase
MTNDNTNAAYGAHLEPFSGIPTFMRRPAQRDLTGVDVAMLGVPFDSGTSYRSGTRFGPRSIREASLLLWGVNAVMDVTPLEVLKVIDYGDVEVIPVDIIASMKAIESEVKKVLDKDVIVGVMGGDHSISLPVLRSHADKYGALSVIHLDAHPDTWQAEFGDHPYSHGTPFRRAIEEGLIDTNAYIQIGIRGPVSGPSDLEEARKLGAKVYTIGRCFEIGIPTLVNSVHEVVGNRPVYISLDIDATDPAFAPGTGTPEVGGFSSYQMLQIVRGLRGLNLVGFDLVEVSPPYDPSGITSILAANLIFEMLSLIALRRASAKK